MKKFEGVLFCTDLDGTLYKTDKTISNENKQAIEYFKENGGHFTFVTGRPHMISSDVYYIVNPNAPIGCNNGGAVYDFENQKYIWAKELDKSVGALIDYIEENMTDMGIQINTHNDIFFHTDNSAMERFRRLTNTERIIKRYNQTLEPILKVIFASEDEAQIEKLSTLLASHPLADNFDFIRSERTLYEILPKGVHKGVALNKLAELLKSRKTVAVGDYDNDIGMLNAADISFAVENASLNAKVAADYITVSNNDHAIAAIINKLDKIL